MKRIIITGFEPFGLYKFNSTGEIAQSYDAWVIEDKLLVGVVLPCSYRGAFEKLKKIIDSEKPSAIISTGLSSSVHGIRFETVFRNIMDGKYPDADLYEPKGELIIAEKNAPMFLSSTADNARLANIVYSHGIPVEVSADADAFICNSLGYLTTRMIINKNLPIKNVFIHIPWTDDYQDMIKLEKSDPVKIFMDREMVTEAFAIIIKNIL